MIEDYLKAKRRGDRQWRRAASEGRYPYLPALNDMVDEVDSLGTTPIGLVEIPLDMIAGTKTAGRQNAFSWGFMPILSDKSEFALKWSKLYDSQMEEGIREAIKVYEYMQRFYVQEGNKRVSVLKYLDMPTILGDVIRIRPRQSDDKAFRIYREFEEFYDVAPIYTISFSQEGRYKELAEIFGQNLKDPWPEEVMETLRSSFQYFSLIYEEKGGIQLPMTVGDAYLLYLSIYSADSLFSESRQILRSRISRIWPEFQARTESEHIHLAELPDSSSVKKGGLIGKVLHKGPDYSLEKPLRAAFLFDRAPEESAWDYGHELGRNYVDQCFGGLVESSRFDHCATDASMTRAMEAVIADGGEVVFTTAPAQMPQTIRAAIASPGIRFLNCSVNLSSDAVRTYYGRMYEAKFLLGALAASVAENHRIGYLAGLPVYGEIAEINAFAIGAAMVDHKARIYLEWKAQDRDWRARMREEGIRVQSGPDLIRPGESERDYGLYETKEDGSVFRLAMPVWNWGKFYELILRSMLSGAWDEQKEATRGQALNFWYGMSSGVIDVILSDKMSYYSRKLVGILKNAVIADTLSPFDGEIHSQQGLIKKDSEPRLSNESVITMDWLNDNIIGSIPELHTIPDEVVRQSVKVGGVPESKKS